MDPLLLKTRQNASYLWKGFQTVNLQAVYQRVQRSLNVTVFKYAKNVWPYHTREIFEYALLNRLSPRSNYTRAKVPFQNVYTFIRWDVIRHPYHNYKEDRYCFENCDWTYVHINSSALDEVVSLV